MFPPDRSARCVGEGSSNGALAGLEPPITVLDVAVPAGFRLSPQQELLLAGASGVPAQCAVDVGEADPVQLRDALVSLTRRYEILRTAFVRSTGMRLPSQIILDEVEPDWGVDDRPAEEVIAEEAARGFEPEAAP